jgi:hypothetical protein
MFFVFFLFRVCDTVVSFVNSLFFCVCMYVCMYFLMYVLIFVLVLSLCCKYSSHGFDVQHSPQVLFL